MKKHFIHVVIPLLIGAGIYAMKYSQKNIAQLNDIHFPKFIYNQLSDFLWMYASMNFLGLIWKNNSRQLMFYQISLLLLACTLEIFQKLKFIPGTFDLKDIATYLLAFAISLIIFKFTLNLQTND